VSYNNLVDWHVAVEHDGVTFVYNRNDPARIVERSSNNDADALRSRAFEEISGRRQNPNLPALDDALIDTISLWRRVLAAELGHAVNNEQLATLFNSIIFARAVEDNLRRYDKLTPSNDRRLLTEWKGDKTLGSHLSAMLSEMSGGDGSSLIQPERLRAFDAVTFDTGRAMLADFYQNRFAPYRYDFSIISKHALSRIYEHYVSMLRPEITQQDSFFPKLPREELDKSFGSIYTPQYIARFFGRFLREQYPPSARSLRVIDPACGSGIFLRTLLELECDGASAKKGAAISEAFAAATGVDRDPNAVEATKLSLALLHLVLTDAFPTKLDVTAADAIDYLSRSDEFREAFDAVVANPPFVSTVAQSDDVREVIRNYLGEHAVGRVDLYLAFLKLAIQITKPGGFGLFVLPHTFLIADSAARMRSLLTQTSWIRVVADLSAIRVFGSTGVYVVLLVFEKKSDAAANPPQATLVKCQDLVGKALQETLRNRIQETPVYSIYQVDQDYFARPRWVLLPPSAAVLSSKLDRLKPLDTYLRVHKGMITGADSVFILPAVDCPPDGSSLFAPFLPDRDMRAYTTPESTEWLVFYPYVNGKKLTEEELQKHPKTWAYLEDHRSVLETRAAVRRQKLGWWEPERPRLPADLLRPKIVSPHLVLTPRFGLDLVGKYAISQSPLLYPREETLEQELLKFFAAILNSAVCYWQITANSHRYSRGYLMLEPTTLKDIRVPDPSAVSPAEMRRLLALVERRISGSTKETETEREIEVVVTRLYGLTDAEREIVGIF